MNVDGLVRTAVCHLPADAPPGPRPLLLVLHGRRITDVEMRRWTRFDALADRHGFVVAYPQGYRQSWNDGRGNTPAARDGVDDVGFIRRLVDHLVEQVGVDPERIAATGLSNGGGMCHRLALALGDRIAAMASVAGLLPASLASVTPACAVSVLLIHGTADPVQPIAGGRPRGLYARILTKLMRGRARGSPLLSLDATAARWRAINRCGGEEGRTWLPATGDDPTRVERVTSGPGQGGTVVERLIVHGGGHTWPGGPRLVTLGRTSTRLDASAAIWAFVSQHFAPPDERRLGEDRRE